MKTGAWLGLAALVLGAPAMAGEDIDERRDLAPDGTVSVSNISGDIDITTWDRAEVRLTGELDEKAELVISGSRDSLRIEVKYPDNNRRGRHVGESDLELVVPVGASLDVNGVSSDITIAGTRGARISAETVSGDVEVTAHTAWADLSSVSGDVEFTGTSPRTSAETVSGDIDLSGVSGELDVSLVSGDVQVTGGSFTRGKFESVSGTIELEMGLDAGGRLTVESMSGDVILLLPAGQAAEIRAQSFSGDIRSAFGSPQKNRSGPGTHLHHETGGGGATIRVESFSGDIEIGQK